jgi:hypothetical protein
MSNRPSRRISSSVGAASAPPDRINGIISGVSVEGICSAMTPSAAPSSGSNGAAGAARSSWRGPF